MVHLIEYQQPKGPRSLNSPPYTVCALLVVLIKPCFLGARNRNIISFARLWPLPSFITFHLQLCGFKPEFCGLDMKKCFPIWVPPHPMGYHDPHPLEWPFEIWGYWYVLVSAISSQSNSRLLMVTPDFPMFSMANSASKLLAAQAGGSEASRAEERLKLSWKVDPTDQPRWGFQMILPTNMIRISWEKMGFNMDSI